MGSCAAHFWHNMCRLKIFPAFAHCSQEGPLFSAQKSALKSSYSFGERARRQKKRARKAAFTFASRQRDQ
jgi:hypothetical protein